MERHQIQNISFLTGRWPLDPDKQTLIFLHGASLSGIIWNHQVDALSDIANTIAIDLPGHGHSAGPGEQSIEGYSAIVEQCIHKLNITKPVLCGLSMGGAIVQQLLLNDRNKTPKTYPAGILISTGARLKVMPIILETIEKDYSGFLQMLNMMVVSGISQQQPSIQAFFKEISTTDQHVVLGDFHACDVFDVRTQIQHIRVPVLVVTADSDSLTPKKYADFLVDTIPLAKRAEVMNSGHLIPIEKPEPLNEILRNFLIQFA